MCALLLRSYPLDYSLTLHAPNSVEAITNGAWGTDQTEESSDTSWPVHGFLPSNPRLKSPVYLLNGAWTLGLKNGNELEKVIIFLKYRLAYTGLVLFYYYHFFRKLLFKDHNMCLISWSTLLDVQMMSCCISIQFDSFYIFPFLLHVKFIQVLNF